MPAQPAEAPPSSLFGQLCHHQIERAGRCQQRQQMQTPQLWRTQSATTTASKMAWTQVVDQRVGNIRRHQIQQPVGASWRMKNRHSKTLTDPSSADNPPISAKSLSYQAFAKTFGTPS